ncbi:MAG: redoxin domain-containing protein [Candidatus Aminicenantes bacterium]|nr:redoxin domain-containing protein [Candidatus Aminicenantes bacterium]
MKIFVLFTCVLFTALGMNLVAFEVAVDKPAPDFKCNDSNGNEHTLSAYEGKIVVLEWLNHDCPFVQKHYRSGNMQKMQRIYTGKDVIWLSVISSAPGKQGFCTPDKANDLTRSKNAHPTAVLLDPLGTVGKKYGAKTTPHMFIINKEGTLVYNGGIDNKRSTDPKDVDRATKYVAKALNELLAGEEVSTKTSAPYGCSVKYK